MKSPYSQDTLKAWVAEAQAEAPEATVEQLFQRIRALHPGADHFLERDVQRVLEGVREQVGHIVGAIQNAPVPSVESIDLATYPGRLKLQCFDCRAERMTAVEFDTPTQVRIDGTVMHVDAVGTRQCLECRSPNVGMLVLSANVSGSIRPEKESP